MSCATPASKPLTVITTTTSFDAWLPPAPEALHVLHLGAQWDEASAAGGPMDVVLTTLSVAHPGVHFARVDSEEVPGVADQFSISVVPTFILFRGKVAAERVRGRCGCFCAPPALFPPPTLLPLLTHIPCRWKALTRRR